MLFWLLFSLFVVSFAYFGIEGKTKNKVTSLGSRVCLVITLSIVVATCGSVFTDHDGYRQFFYYLSKKTNFEYTNIIDFIFIKNESADSLVENGFSFLTWLIGRFPVSHIGYFFIIGIITNLLLVESFYRFKYPIITFFIFISTAHFSQEMNLVRQMIAVAAIMNALILVEKRKWWWFLLCVLGLFVIHQSSLVCLLFLPLCFISNYESFWIKFKFVVFPLYIFSVLVALKVINFDLSYYANTFDLYQGYLSNENDVGTKFSFIDIPYNFFIVLSFFLYKGNDSKIIYAVSFIVGGIISNLSIQTPNFVRIALYFSIVYSAFIPEMLGDFKNKRFRGISIISMYLLIFYHCALISSFISSGNYIGTKVESFFDFFM